MKTDHVTAIHESAHSVVACVFGFVVGLVQLHQPGARPNEAGRCELASWRQDLNEDPARVLVFVLSGAAGEKRLTGRTSPRDGFDRELAAGIASTILELEDTRHPRVRALVASAEAQARALMCDEIVWRAVERCATALQRSGVLSGRAVQVILREAKR